MMGRIGKFKSSMTHSAMMHDPGTESYASSEELEHNNQNVNSIFRRIPCTAAFSNGDQIFQFD